MQSKSKVSSITKYLEHIDTNLHQVFEDLCLFSLFRTRGAGITFLYPSNAEYRREITNKAYSNNPEDAVAMIKSLVLLDYLPTPTEFANKKDDIPNAHRKKLVVESTDRHNVSLASGHTLVVDKRFTAFRQDEMVAVYTLSGDGALPSGEVVSEMKYANTRTKRQSTAQRKTPEKDLAECVESLYNNKQFTDVYRGIMGMVYGCIASNGNASVAKLVYDGICASDRASFYNIVAPYKLERNYDISTVLENSGICQLGKHSAVVIRKALKKGNAGYATSMQVITSLCKVTTQDIASRMQQRNKLRNKLFSMINNPIDSKTVVLKTYGNNVNGLYKDLLTMYCHIAKSDEYADPGAFNNFLFSVKHVFNHKNSFSKTSTETGFALTLYYNLIKSDAFMYVPIMSKDQLEKNKDGNCIYTSMNYDLPSPNDTSLFTIQFNNKNDKSGGAKTTDTDTDGTSYFGGILNSIS